MKVAQINPYCGIGSTGKICEAISNQLDFIGCENRIFYNIGESKHKNGIKYVKSSAYVRIQSLYSKIFGNNGFNNYIETKNLIKALQRFNPDIVHLHNLHGQNVNLKMLFDYLIKEEKKVVWTFHDCWTMTGYCHYFDVEGCNGWLNECINCPHYKKFSWIVDRAHENYIKKKNISSNIKINIVTPSIWLANGVKKSMWKNNSVSVINNGIDLQVFSNKYNDVFRDFHNKGKKVILGVADLWDYRKGIDVFNVLRKKLDDNYEIVLVGRNVSNSVDSGIRAIDHTKNQLELAAIYSSADLFVNPTRAEVFGMVNIEALACGTPVVTFDSGGSPECVDEICGRVVKKDDVDGLIRVIKEMITKKDDVTMACRRRAELFEKGLIYNKYLKLYNEVLDGD